MAQDNLETTVEKFKWSDPFLLCSKGNANNNRINMAREGYYDGKYRGVRTHSIKLGKKYVYASAVITYDRHTPETEVLRMFAHARKFIDEVRSNSYSGDISNR